MPTASARTVALAALVLAEVAGLAGCATAISRSRGNDALTEGRYTEAIEHYLDVLYADAEDEEALEGLASAREAAAQKLVAESDAARAAGDYGLAYRAADGAARVLPTDPAIPALVLELETEHRHALSTLARARRAVATGDCMSATALLEPLAGLSPTLPEVTDLDARARGTCVRHHLAEGDRQMTLSAYPRAAEFFRRALRYAPDSAEVRARIADAEAHVRARTLAAEGRETLHSGRWQTAMQTFEQALQKVKTFGPARVGLDEARRVGALEHLSVCAASIADRKFPDAVRACAGGLELARGFEQLTRHLTAHDWTARRRLAARHLARARRLTAGRLHGAALVYAKVASRLAPDLTGVPELMSELETATGDVAVYRYRLDRLGNRSGVGDVGAMVQEALRSRLASGLSSGRAVEASGGRVHGVISGTVSRFEIAPTTPVTNRRKKRYFVATERYTNPVLGERMRSVGDAKFRLMEAEGELAAAEAAQRRAYDALGAADRELNNARRAEPKPKPGTTSMPHPTKRLLRAQSRRANAQLGVTTAQNRVNSRRGNRNRANQGLRLSEGFLEATPPTLTRDHYADYDYEEVTMGVRATAAGKLTLRDVLVSKPLAAHTGQSSSQVTDVVREAFDPAGIKADGLSLPSDEDMRQRLVDGLAGSFAPPLIKAIAGHAERFTKLAAGSKGDLELHYRVLAIVAGAADKAAHAESVRQVSGLRWGPGTLDLEALAAP